MKKSRLILFLGGALVGLGLAAGWAALRQRPGGTGALAVVYLSPAEAPELWLSSPDGREKRQLTRSGGQVYDAAAFADGSRIVYSVGNALGGLDVWLVERSGGGAKRLIDCGADRCQEAAPAPDGGQIAYSRRSAAENPSGSPAAGRIWLYSIVDGSTHALVPDALVNGSQPTWSPDGRQLAFYDSRAGAIHVLRLADGRERHFQTDLNAPGSWSPDGKQLAFAASQQALEGPQGRLFVGDVESGQARSVAAEAGGLDFGPPDWGKGGWLAVGAIRLEQGPGREIWLVRADGSEQRALTEDGRYSNGALSWSPDGTQLLSQRIGVTASGSRPEVLIWSTARNQAVVLAENAALPVWLP